MSQELTVFVVDDDLGARRSMRWLLESDGLTVETFASGKEFVSAVKPETRGCVVLDLQMPDMDGLEVQEELLSSGYHLPVVFVTGHGDVPRCARAMKNGAIDFLEKPIDDALLLKRVREALQEGQQRHRFDAARPEIAARMERLTPREREVMEHLYTGRTTKSVAVRLGISIQTASKHRTRVLSKLQVDGEAGLARLLDAYRTGK